MFESLQTPDEMLRAAIDVLHQRDDRLLAALDELPAPIYVTDTEGYITYFNASCVGFAGRTPKVGKDRWCVTWKLYTDAGEFLPHDQCPMADAIKNKRPIRGVTAVAERPDGARVNFLPYPTPLFSDGGEFLGAVNMLIDVTEKRQAGELRSQAIRCRRLAASVGDKRTSDALNHLASEYEEKATELDRLRTML